MPGRNDPCPCGSGKKYKNCCLRKEMKERAEQRQEMSPPDSEAGWGPSEPAFEPDPLQERIGDMYETLDNAPYEEKWDVIDAVLREEPELLEGEVIFEIGQMMLAHAAQHGEMQRFERLLDRVQQAAPEAYEKELAFLLECRFESALLRRDWAAVREAFLQFTPLAGKELDGYGPLVSALAYYDRVDTLLEGMHQALPHVRDAVEKEVLVPWALPDYASKLVNFQALHSLREDPHLTADHPQLQEIVAASGLEMETEHVNEALAYRSGRKQPAWMASDFSPALVEDDEVDPALVHIELLLMAWVHYALAEEDVPEGRAELARHQFLEYFLERSDDLLEDRMPGRRRRGRGGQTDDAARGRALLVPDRDTLDYRLEGVLSLLSWHPYEASALLQMIPVWLRFLTKLELIDEKQATATLRGVQSVYQKRLKLLEREVRDRQVAQDLRQWFGGSL